MTIVPNLAVVAARLKSSTSIAAVIGQTLPLKPNGHRLVGLCPFHSERTPSFFVFDDHYIALAVASMAT